MQTSIVSESDAHEESDESPEASAIFEVVEEKNAPNVTFEPEQKSFDKALLSVCGDEVTSEAQSEQNRTFGSHGNLMVCAPSRQLALAVCTAATPLVTRLPLTTTIDLHPARVPLTSIAVDATAHRPRITCALSAPCRRPCRARSTLTTPLTTALIARRDHEDR